MSELASVIERGKKKEREEEREDRDWKLGGGGEGVN